MATHDSNLVMGVRAAQLIALESRGEHGRIRVQGSLRDPKITREMIEILEGGVGSFEKRLNIFEEFVNRAHGQIRDIDIALIESSFRRRTIDRFRNFLQPIVSDKALLDFVRHELKNLKVELDARIREDVYNVQKQLHILNQSDLDTHERLIRLPELFAELKNLSDHLDGHVTKLKEAIEEIRLMDTQARPTNVNLFECLSKLKKEYLHLGARRQIHIDIDERISGQSVYIDEDHLKLIFRNLINNSLRATETRAFDVQFEGGIKIPEIIRIDFFSASDGMLILKLSDNGCGIHPEILEKLYVERCSDQSGRDHGLGGIIIRKLLDINNGRIRIVESNQVGENIGTIQEILLKKGSDLQ
jgi:signal transduction histidine kinase